MSWFGKSYGRELEGRDVHKRETGNRVSGVYKVGGEELGIRGHRYFEDRRTDRITSHVFLVI